MNRWLESLYERAKERDEKRIRSRFDVTDDGVVTFDGNPIDYTYNPCPQPFPDCRPGACNCDGIRDHWRAWGKR